jgi:hypothetical protein
LERFGCRGVAGSSSLTTETLEKGELRRLLGPAIHSAHSHDGVEVELPAPRVSERFSRIEP